MTTTPPNVLLKNNASRSALLQSIGLLCALIFVINYTYELLDIHGLYQSQHFLIAWLLWVLSGWALLEAVLLARAKLVFVTHLLIALCMQLFVEFMRHGSHFVGPNQVTGSLRHSGTLEIGMTVVYGPIYLVQFLVISALLIRAFSDTERVRANQLEEQVAINRRAEEALRISEEQLQAANKRLAASNLELNAANDELAKHRDQLESLVLARTLELTKAEAASVAKSHFLSSMSHEIRTPLNGVLGMAELLQGTPLNEEQMRLVGTISSSGQALHELLSDILDLTKIEEGLVTIERIDFDPTRLVSDISAVCHEIALSREI